MKSTGSAAMDSYLREVARLSRVLPPAVRAELLSELAGHLGRAATASGPGGGEAAGDVAARMGDPAEVVRAAVEAEGLAVTTRPAAWTVAWLTAGSLLPLIGWLVGLYRVWSSTVWSLYQKLAMTVCVPFGLTGVFWFAVVSRPWSSYSCSAQSSSEYDGAGRLLATTPKSVACTSPTVPGWAGLAAVLALVVLALGVPLLNLIVVRGRAARVRQSGPEAALASMR